VSWVGIDVVCELVGVLDVDFETSFVDIGLGVSPIEVGP